MSVTTLYIKNWLIKAAISLTPFSLGKNTGSPRLSDDLISSNSAESDPPN